MTTLSHKVKTGFYVPQESIKKGIENHIKRKTASYEEKGVIALSNFLPFTGLVILYFDTYYPDFKLRYELKANFPRLIKRLENIENIVSSQSNGNFNKSLTQFNDETIDIFQKLQKVDHSKLQQLHEDLTGAGNRNSKEVFTPKFRYENNFMWSEHPLYILQLALGFMNATYNDLAKGVVIEGVKYTSTTYDRETHFLLKNCFKNCHRQTRTDTNLAGLEIVAGFLGFRGLLHNSPYLNEFKNQVNLVFEKYTV